MRFLESMIDQLQNVRKAKENHFDWIPKKTLKKDFELRGEHQYARLTWKKMLGSLAIGETSEGKYSLKREGFLNPKINLRKLDLDYEIARMKMTLGGNGELIFDDGHTYKFQKLNFWKLEWGFLSSDGKILCTFRMKSIFKKMGEVVVEKDAKRVHHLPLLLIIGWYAAVLITEESRAASTAGAS